MADFYDVHRKQMHAADRKLRPGEIWSIALLEPFDFVTDKPDGVNESFVTIVGFVVTADGALEPARPMDHESIADWKRRHRETPSYRFGLPEGLLTAGQG